jgi:ABC-2 type transport system permease protein
VLTLLFTALGFGFFLSLFARTEMQAVQYAMFVLLASVFFSGFFLDLRYLWEPVRAISWILPSTYGIRLLQDLMLRGEAINTQLFVTLAGIGILFFMLCWFFLRRRLQAVWS